jgi:hypothetical protein
MTPGDMTPGDMTPGDTTLGDTTAIALGGRYLLLSEPRWANLVGRDPAELLPGASAPG